MDLMPILSTIILIATIITLIVAIVAYVVFRLRERETNKQPVLSPATLPSVVTPIATQPIAEQSQESASSEDRLCRICEDPAKVKTSCPFRRVSGFCFLADVLDQQPDRTEAVVNNSGLKFRIYQPPTLPMWK